MRKAWPRGGGEEVRRNFEREFNPESRKGI
jgi:hypothetical protein